MDTHSNYALQCPHNKVTVPYLHCISPSAFALGKSTHDMFKNKFKTSCCFQEIEGRIIYLLDLNVATPVRAFDFNDT